MSRTIIDLPDEQLAALASLSKRKKISRAALVRKVIAKYLEEQSQSSQGDLDKYFGKAKGKAFDGMEGVEWQRKIRGQSEERDKLYRGWSKLTLEEWNERFQRYLNNEPI